MKLLGFSYRFWLFGRTELEPRNRGLTPGKTCQERGRGDRQSSRLLEVEACLWTRLSVVVAFQSACEGRCARCTAALQASAVLNMSASIHHDRQEMHSRIRSKRIPMITKNRSLF